MPGSVADLPTESTTPTTSMPVFDADLLPTVPAPTALSGIDPQARATELVAATSDELDDVAAGWAAVYAELAIPITDPAGVSTIADDPVGPRWDHVWAIGGLNSNLEALCTLSIVANMLGTELRNKGLLRCQRRPEAGHQ